MDAMSGIELLEGRRLLCGLHEGVADVFDPTGRALDDQTPAYTARINFGPISTADVPGYVKDVGEPFSAKPDGTSFGWTTPVAKAKVRNSIHADDDRYDSFLATKPGARWELALPAGQYVVRIAAGDARGRGVHRFDVEGVAAIDGVTNKRQRWQETTLTVDVTDGALTVDVGRGKLSFIDVYPLDSSETQDAADPIPTEPSPADATSTTSLSLAVGSSSFPTSVRWTTVTPNPLARAEAVGNVVNGKLYVIGGFNGRVPNTRDTYIARARGDAYDPATNQWSRIANMPEAFTHATGVVVGDQIWFVGGYVGNHPGPAYAKVWKYDVSDNRWTRGPSLPEARGAGGAALIDNTIYFVGGMDRDRVHDERDVWALDLNRQGRGWVEMASMPTARNHLSVVSLDGKLYAISGQWDQEEDQVALTKVEIYNPTSNAWTTGASMPSPRSHVTSAVFAYDGRIVIAGGETGFNAVRRELYAYDPAANRWSIMGYLPSARSTMVAGALPDGRIIGSTGNSPTTTRTTWIGRPQ